MDRRGMIFEWFIGGGEGGDGERAIVTDTT